MALEQYDKIKIAAKALADSKREVAEANYRFAVAKDSRPYAVSEAEDRHRKALADALNEYQDTVAAALAAA
jgi:hypothetical protein